MSYFRLAPTGGWESGLEKLKLADTPPGLSESSRTNGNTPSTAKRRGASGGSSSRTKPPTTNGILEDSMRQPPGLSKQPGGENRGAAPPGLVLERLTVREERLSGATPSRPLSDSDAVQECNSNGAGLDRQLARDQMKSPGRPSNQQQSGLFPSSQRTGYERQPAREEREADSPPSRQRPGLDWQPPRSERVSGTVSCRSTPQRPSAPSPGGNSRAWSDWVRSSKFWQCLGLDPMCHFWWLMLQPIADSCTLYQTEARMFAAWFNSRVREHLLGLQNFLFPVVA